ncbi:MAG TPA: metalloregulator ArsR/SmtB family transcription factor [Puia sp.]|jgi:DNA-binding transcriptional ArsR family regulator|nr:metalloregulator ArsR/SmtB family transcription factor [Puia sp.]
MQTRRDVFQAIADPIRRDIIGLVARQPMNLNSIAENFSVSRPAISQHIKVLTECGLIFIVRQGRERFCEARLAPLGQVADWMEPFRQMWDRQFTALDQLLERMQSEQLPKHKATKNNKNHKP